MLCLLNSVFRYAVKQTNKQTNKNIYSPDAIHIKNYLSL